MRTIAEMKAEAEEARSVAAAARAVLMDDDGDARAERLADCVEALLYALQWVADEVSVGRDGAESVTADALEAGWRHVEEARKA